MNLPVLGKFWWLVVFSAVAIPVSVLTILYITGNSVSACPENLSGIFTVSLIDTNQISGILPLGWTNGQDHILPVDHVGFVTNNNGSSVSPKLPVYSPGNIIITKLSSHQDYYANGKPYSNAPNYMIDANVCRGIRIWIEGIHELSPVLQDIFNKSNKKYSEAPLNAGDKATNYDLEISYKAKTGELLGWTGGYDSQDSVSISAWNDNLKPRSDIDFSYYSDSRANIICFADLYSGELKDILYSKFGQFDINKLNFTPSTAEPRCGQVIQNVVGTIQGDWFVNKPANFENLQSEGKTLSFIHNNIDPTIDIISIGGTVTAGPQTIAFLPVHSGIINREFDETVTGAVYCYQTTYGGSLNIVPQNVVVQNKIIVQLLDDRHLKIESQLGKCTGSESFVNPYTYQR